MIVALLAVGACLAASGAESPAEKDDVLRVCSDADNMPLSNDKGEGYENKIAEQLARHLGRRVEYTYFPQRMGFVRNTLRQRDAQTQRYRCDVIIGVPAGYELTATTRPYMRSTYALVFPARNELANLKSAEDLLAIPKERLQRLRFGVFAQSPGADWLLRNGLQRQAAYYAQQSGDPHENPARTIERELTAGRIDAAIVWGPIAGLLAREHAKFPAWRAVAFTPESSIKFDYEIAMGVRFGEKEWKETLDDWIATHQRQIDAILADYQVPLVDSSGKVTAGFVQPDVRAGSVEKRIPLQLESRQPLQETEK
jgi:quinoprotein dehydrogenase-associated probable ABC transporter substrate-binding protein